MTTKAYTTRNRQKKATPTIPAHPLRKKTWDSTSSDLFDSLRESTLKKPAPNNTRTKQGFEKKPRSFGKGQRSSTVGDSPLCDTQFHRGQLKQNSATAGGGGRTYKYSYSSHTAAVSSAPSQPLTLSQSSKRPSSVKSQSSSTVTTKPSLAKPVPNSNSLKIFDFNFSDDDQDGGVGVVSTKMGVAKTTTLSNNSKARLKTTIGKGGVTKNRKATSSIGAKNGHVAKQVMKVITKPLAPVAMETSSATKDVGRSLKRKGSACTLTPDNANTSLPSKKAKLSVNDDVTVTSNHGDDSSRISSQKGSTVHHRGGSKVDVGVVISEIAKRTRSSSRSSLKGEESTTDPVPHSRSTLMSSIIATRTRSANKQQHVTTVTKTTTTTTTQIEKATPGQVDSSNMEAGVLATGSPLADKSTLTGTNNSSVKATSIGKVKSQTMTRTSKLEVPPPKEDAPSNEVIDLTDTEMMEESPDLSLSEPADGPAFKVDFDRHLAVKKNPQLRKSSSYSLSSGPSPLSPRHTPSPSSKHPHTVTPSPPSQLAKHRQQPSLSVAGGKGVPSLVKSSSWPNKQYNITNKNRNPSGLIRSLFGGGGSPSSSASSGGVAVGVASSNQDNKGDKPPLVTVVRNVRQAHECLEIGESQQFFDEIHYLLDSMKPSRPINARCLSTCNLAIQYLDSEFSQQLRAHSFTAKITALLKDCLDHPPLCLSAAVLFYIMTRDKLNSEWNKTGTELLIRMLAMETTPTSSGDHTHSGKTAREMIKIEKKARSILNKYQDKQRLRNSASPQSVAKQPSTTNVSSEPEAHNEDVPVISVSGEDQNDKGSGNGDGNGGKKEESREQVFMVNTDTISISELAQECLLSLTSAHHNSHWLREELRIAGGIDVMANMVISSCDGLSHVDGSGISEASSDYTDSVCARIAVLERQLKCLENVTLNNKDNQSYCVVFDGSMLISKLIRIFSLLQEFIKHNSLRSSTQNCLVAVFKFLLNVTHDNQLGCHRIGEQKEVMDALLRVAFQLTQYLPEESRFDVVVLVLGLLINLTEHSNNNRRRLESTSVDYYGNCDQNGPKNDESDDLEILERDIRGCHANNSSLRALIFLFLTHYSKAESANIEVPTPQRLSQLSGGTPMTSPQRGEQAKRDLTSSFADRLKSSRTPQLPQSSNSSSQDNSGDSQKSNFSQSDGTGWLSEQVLLEESTSKEVTRRRSESVEENDEQEEPFERIQTDPLVFSREEFDAALHQAGQHMEDSIIASYSALLLGILVRHNHDCIDVVKSCMPSKKFTEMIGMLRKFISFMNMAGSLTGLDSIRHIVTYLEAV